MRHLKLKQVCVAWLHAREEITNVHLLLMKKMVCILEPSMKITISKTINKQQ